MIAEKYKNWIDNASYQDLLHKWRFALPGDPHFIGEVGDYYIAKMKELRDAENGNEMHVAASKAIGWEK